MKSEKQQPENWEKNQYKTAGADVSDAGSGADDHCCTGIFDDSDLRRKEEDDMLKKFTESMRERVQMFVAEMQAETGLSVVEMILILVVIIALVLIFKTQLTTLVNDIFEKITSESAGI